VDISVHFRINTPRIIYEIIDEEAIVIDFDTGIYYSLDKVGSEIWSIIEKEASASQIIDALLRRYSGERIVMEKHIAQFIARLKTENLIVLSTRGPDEVRIQTQMENAAKTEQPVFETPILSKYSDMQELLLLDPIHEVDEAGWPAAKPEPINEDEESTLHRG